MAGILEILCGIVILLLFALYYHYTVKFNFWKKRNIPGPKAIPFFGTTKNVALGKISMMEYYKKIYCTYKDVPFVGIFEYSTPILIIKDPVLIKNVLITDSTVFGGRGFDYTMKAEPIKQHIVHMSGKEALLLKAEMSPIFTPRKIKSMFPLLLERTKVIKAWLDSLVSQNKQIDCGEMINRLVGDISANYIFNCDIKSLEDRDNDVLRYTKRISEINWRNRTKQLLSIVAKRLYNLMGYYLFDNAEVTKFFIRFFWDISKYREEHGIDKDDVIGVLMKLKQNPGKLGEIIEISDEFIAAQIYGIFAGSFETTSTTITNILYELSSNQSVQERLREEIQSVCAKNNGKVTLDDINAMSYLDAVIKETLRRYPIIDVIIRQALSDYVFTKSQIFIPKGQLIIVPVYAIHHDSDIHPNPEVYDPERFLDKAASFKQSMSYIPFGHGSRSCLAKQFGTLQIKIVLITILQNYKVDMWHYKNNDPTYSAGVIIRQPKGIYIKLTKIY